MDNYTYEATPELGALDLRFEIDPETESTAMSGTIVQKQDFYKMQVILFVKNIEYLIAN